jgi:membrane-anchored protein YejM (alkaline phosphatase superfamily)
MESKHLVDVLDQFLLRANQSVPIWALVAFRCVHVPYVASPELRANCSSAAPDSICNQGPTLNSRQLDYAGCLSAIDTAVGRVRALLKVRRPLDWENTILVFASDNGPETVRLDGSGSSGGLVGMKRSLFEGGIRTPCLVEWPAVIHSNIVSNALVTINDLPATLEAVLTNNHPLTKRDGRSLLPLFQSPATFQRDNYVVVCNADNSAVNRLICPSLAVMDPTGTYKLMVARQNPLSRRASTAVAIGLYLVADETKDVTTTMHELASKMQQVAQVWLDDVFADFKQNCAAMYPFWPM